ncbi:MAG: tRNA pseudouridine(13) synthase TruD [Phycisphaerae bacterium]|jgi:tRNA pseudouridine13 synthase
MTTIETLPYLTADLPGIGGRLKERVEDFRVEEIPLYEPCGQGDHLYFRVTKTGIPTPAAVDRLARHMGVQPPEIGVAGLKDAQAVTSQTMSLEHADAHRLAAYRDSQMSVTVLARHGNKLRPGHLAGNRFIIRLRGVGPEQLAPAQAVLDVLARRGVPNYFGAQRFGARGETAQLGRALVKGDLDGFVSLYLGQSAEGDPPDCRAARDAFDAGYFDRALQRWPRHYFNERRALSAYKRGKRPGPAIAAIDKRMRRLYVSAFQSAIFNEVLTRRIGTIDRVLAGDLAQKEDSGGVFSVQDVAAEQARADHFEISPTGPIAGYRGNLAGGEMGQIEQEALARWQVDLEDFRRVGTLKIKGGRRALRFPLRQVALTGGSDQHGSFLELAFAAPSGCYATVVLREVMKAGLDLTV